MHSVRRQASEARRDADRWFRELGLPTFVPLGRWFTDLPRRVAPLVVWVTIVGFLLQDGIDDIVDIAVDAFGTDEMAILLFIVVLLLASAAIAWGGYLLVRWLLRRLPIGLGTIVAVLVILLCMGALIVGGYLVSPRATVGPVFETLAVIALCILVTGMGGGALVSWASRLAIRNASAIGHMASIALPVILMLVVFAFFSAEVWQMASALHWWSLGLVGLVVGVLAVLVVLRVCASEIDDAAATPTVEQRAALLDGTPAESHAMTPAARRPLRIAQRVNILLVMAFAQILQALFFALLLCGLLILIGSIAIPYGVVEIWVGPGSAEQPLPVERLEIGSATLPVTVNLLKAAGLLSLIATLPFVFSAVSEQRYRERFFDPIMADMRRAMLVRDALVSAGAGATDAPTPPAPPTRRRRAAGRRRA